MMSNRDASHGCGFVRRVLAVGEMDIAVDGSGDLDWRLTRRSDVVEMMRGSDAVEVFVIMTEMADALAFFGDVDWSLARRSRALEMR